MGNRVWWTTQPTGTHTADLLLGGTTYPPTNKRWHSPPECGSATFDAEGRCFALTGGYVMDRRMGNTDGFGGVYGLAIAIGLRPPSPLWLARTPTQNWDRMK